MRDFAFHLPTRMMFGRDIFAAKAAVWKEYGHKALLVTGKHSARVSGMLAKVEGMLRSCGQDWVHYDGVGENPLTSMIDEAADLARREKVDFVVGIGGGSAMDTAKVVAALMLRPESRAVDVVDEVMDTSIPIVCVPTTAGTGSETTPYAVVTAAERGNAKSNTRAHLFPVAAWLDASGTRSLPHKVRVHTTVDALCQNIEGMLTVRATPLTDTLALDSLSRMAPALSALAAGQELSDDMLDTLLYAASMSGVVIAQTGISLPHVLGYNLTDAYGLPHGQACGVLLPQYMAMHPDGEKVAAILSAAGFADLEALSSWLDAVLGPKPMGTAAQLQSFLPDIMGQAQRLASFPLPLGEGDVMELYREAVSM